MCFTSPWLPPHSSPSDSVYFCLLSSCSCPPPPPPPPPPLLFYLSLFLFFLLFAALISLSRKRKRLLCSPTNGRTEWVNRVRGKLSRWVSVCLTDSVFIRRRWSLVLRTADTALRHYKHTAANCKLCASLLVCRLFVEHHYHLAGTFGWHHQLTTTTTTTTHSNSHNSTWPKVGFKSSSDGSISSHRSLSVRRSLAASEESTLLLYYYFIVYYCWLAGWLCLAWSCIRRRCLKNACALLTPKVLGVFSVCLVCALLCSDHHHQQKQHHWCFIHYHHHHHYHDHLWMPNGYH